MRKILSEEGNTLLEFNEEEAPFVEALMNNMRGLVALEQYLGIRISEQCHKFPLDPYPEEEERFIDRLNKKLMWFPEGA